MFYSIITQNGNALTILGVTDPRSQALLTMIGSLGVPIGTFLYWGAGRLPTRLAGCSWISCWSVST